MLARTLVLGVTTSLWSWPAHAAWTALTDLERQGALVSALAIDLGNNTVIASLHPETRLTPASLTKLITAAAVLEAWPADKTFQTSLLASGQVHDGVLGGDLILRGAGDPSFDDHSLWELAAQLKGYDITSISGRLVISPSPFGSVSCGTKDRCDALHGSANAYNAPIASIGVDFGNWCIIVRPTEVGREAQVRGCAVAHLPLAMTGTIRTAPAGARQTLRVERETGPAGDILRLSGEIALGPEQRVWRAMSDSALGVGLLLAQTLNALGITVAGGVVVSEAPLPPNAYPLAILDGLTLREQLGRMLRFSNNYIADVLTMDLAVDTLATPPADLSGAALVLTQFMGRLTGRMPHAGSGAQQQGPSLGPSLLSGSGLTIENRLSASDLATLLAYQYHNTAHFPAFYGALTVPREAPFGFMRVGSDAWLDRVAFKTGTMNEPVSVCGIAGYLRKRDGGWIAFAVIVNGGPGASHIPHETAMRAVRSDLEDILAHE